MPTFTTPYVRSSSCKVNRSGGAPAPDRQTTTTNNNNRTTNAWRVDGFDVPSDAIVFHVSKDDLAQFTGLKSPMTPGRTPSTPAPTPAPTPTPEPTPARPTTMSMRISITVMIAIVWILVIAASVEYVRRALGVQQASPYRALPGRA